MNLGCIRLGRLIYLKKFHQRAFWDKNDQRTDKILNFCTSSSLPGYPGVSYKGHWASRKLDSNGSG